MKASGDHVLDQLGPHYLGALEPAESDAVDRHLGDCAGCRVAAREVCEVVAALALLDDDPEPPLIRARGSAGQRNSAGPGPVRPRGRATSSAPVTRSRSRRQRIALTRMALALAVLLFAGFGTLFVVGGMPGENAPSLVAVSVTGSEPGTGACATVFATAMGSGVHLRVTATGLRAGRSYELLAVTSDEQTHDVSRWTAGPEAQDIAGDVPDELADLAFVAISEAGGPFVVRVYLHGDGAAAPR